MLWRTKWMFLGFCCVYFSYLSKLFAMWTCINCIYIYSLAVIAVLTIHYCKSFYDEYHAPAVSLRETHTFKLIPPLAILAALQRCDKTFCEQTKHNFISYWKAQTCPEYFIHLFSASVKKVFKQWQGDVHATSGLWIV